MDIVIHIDKYRAAKRISGAYLTHNSDIRIVVSADPESGFDLSQPTSMIVVTARGEYPPITASGGVFAAPLLTREDIPEGVRVGFTQGSVRTTRGANMDLIRTISDHPGASADPHADEYGRVIEEIGENDKFLIERASDGYRGAAPISILLALLGEASAGASAYEIAVENGFEGTEEEWLDSLRGAAGADGNDGMVWASYGETTFAEITAAVAAEKRVLVNRINYEGCIYSLVGMTSPNTYLFTSAFRAAGFDTPATYCAEAKLSNGATSWSNYVLDAVSVELLQVYLASYFPLSGVVTSMTSNSTNSQVPTAKAVYEANNAKADKVTTVTVDTSGAVTQALDPGKIYVFGGELTALTITLNAPVAGQLPQYHFVFVSGATAPTVTLPNSVQMPDDWAVETNTRYEIDILDGYGLASSWEVTQK